jgi:hypothetical protein
LTLQRLRLIGPCAWLLYGDSALLAARAAWLLATSRRPLVVAVWRLVRPKVSRVVLRLTPAGWLRRGGSLHRPCAAHADGPPAVHQIGLRPERLTEE